MEIESIGQIIVIHGVQWEERKAFVYSEGDMAPVPRRLICSALTVLCVVPLLDAADREAKPPSTQQTKEVIRDHSRPRKADRRVVSEATPPLKEGSTPKSVTGAEVLGTVGVVA